MSLIDELIFILAISLIVTALIIRLLSIAADDAAAPKKSPAVVKESFVSHSSAALCTTEPACEASAAGESQIKQSAPPPERSLVELSFDPLRLSRKAYSRGKQAPILPSPGVVYRVDSPGSARDCTLGKSAARESGNLGVYGESGVESSWKTLIGSLSPEGEDNAAIVAEAAAAARDQLIRLLSPKGVGPKAEDQVFDEAKSNSDYDLVEYDVLDGSSKSDDVNIEEAGSKTDYDLVEYQVIDESSKSDHIDIEEAGSKSDEDLTEYQVFDESSKRESIVAKEARSESDGLFEYQVFFDETSERENINIEEARSKSDDWIEPQVFNESSSQRDNINIIEAMSVSDDLVEGSTELRETEHVETWEDKEDAGEVIEENISAEEGRSKSSDDLLEFLVFDESPERDSINIIEARSESDDDSREDLEILEELRVSEREDAGEVIEELGDNVGDQDDEFIDDWEGIERTELEKRFGAAVAFVGSRSNAGRISRLSNGTKMKLYGLHKVAIEGPCLVAQPMAFKVTARANWNAWKVLGNMTPETAMEQYIALLSSSVPAWIQDGKKDDQELDRELPPSTHTDSLDSLVIYNQSLPEELRYPTEVHGPIGAV